MMKSVLFSTTPVVGDSRKPPVVIVGLPRSGTSFLSHILSQIEDWYVFDDLYLYRTAQGIGADGPLNNDQLNQLIHFLGWQVRARIKHKKFNPPNMSLEDVDQMDDALRETFRECDVLWHQLQEEWLTRLALHHGCSRWGYKAPQDFMNIQMLNKLYPGIKYVYLYRDPREMMASLKHISGRIQDGKSGQYHPYVYAKYWKLAAETMEAAAIQMPGRVYELKFENLVADTEKEAANIARFLDAKQKNEIVIVPPNTSFKSGQRRRITPTEEWICENIAGNVMRRKGYNIGNSQFRLKDILIIISVSLHFAGYQLKRSFTDKSAFVSIKSFIRSLVKS